MYTKHLYFYMNIVTIVKVILNIEYHYGVDLWYLAQQKTKVISLCFDDMFTSKKTQPPNQISLSIMVELALQSSQESIRVIGFERAHGDQVYPHG